MHFPSAEKRMPMIRPVPSFAATSQFRLVEFVHFILALRPGHNSQVKAGFTPSWHDFCEDRHHVGRWKPSTMTLTFTDASQPLIRRTASANTNTDDVATTITSQSSQESGSTAKMLPPNVTIST